MSVPTKIFFTKGVGRHREQLTSFELALRDADRHGPAGGVRAAEDRQHRGAFHGASLEDVLARFLQSPHQLG